MLKKSGSWSINIGKKNTKIKRINSVPMQKKKKKRKTNYKAYC